MDANATLAELRDREEIRDLLHRYAQAIDRRDAALLATLVTPDCRLHYGADYDVPAARLVAEWRADVPSPFLATHHLIGNVRIAFTGRDQARAVSYLAAVHRARRAGALVDELIRARYLDRLVRRAGRWQFAERWLVYDWSKVLPADEEPWWPRGSLEGAWDGADPAARFLDGVDPVHPER